LPGSFYHAGTYFGAHGGSEAAGLLWSLADSIVAALDHKGGDR
jgi:hypothetical protein